MLRTTWMNLENIMLSESSQVEKAAHYMIPFTRKVQNRQMQKGKGGW